MASIFTSNKLHNLLLSITLVAFSMTYAMPCAAYQMARKIDIDEAALMMRLHKLVDDLYSNKDKGSRSDMLKNLLHLKLEVEYYTGKSIDMSKAMEIVQTTLREAGFNISPKELKKYQKMFLQKEKEFHDKKMEMHHVLLNEDYIEDIDYFQLKSGKEEVENKELPIKVVFGVTVMLCGLFLMFLPMPQSQVWGKYLLEAGTLIAVEGGLDKKQKDQDEKHKK